VVTTSKGAGAELIDVASRLRLAIVRVARRMRQEASADLSPTLTAALGTVDRHGPLTPSELAEIERVQRPTATRIVGRLTELELIERTADPRDARSFLITASPAGRRLLRRLRGRKNAYLARRLRELEPSEVATLARAATILEDVLERERR
jgi:DNA-binding MarR family transcriptional regulator